MTEQAAPTTQNTQIPPAPPLQINPQQLAAIREALVNQFVTSYREFIQKIVTMPGMRIPIAKGLEFFDTGFLWFKEGLQSLQAEAISMVPAAPPADVVPVAPNATTSEASSASEQAPQPVNTGAEADTQAA